MHRIGAGTLDGVEDPVDDDIGLAGRRGADMDGLVGLLHMQRVGIGIRIDGDRLDAHLLRRPDDPAGNLTTIGNEDFGDRHGYTSTLSSKAWGKFRSEEHTSELQSLMRISYAVFCLKKKI